MVIVSLLLTDQIARYLGLPRAAGLLCLASLAALVVCVRLGWRQALMGMVGLALRSIPAALSQRDPLEATLVSTPMAVQHHWHITGLWLILTPFLVLRPFVRDAWKVALHRSLGTIAGVLLVMVLALLLLKSLPLQVPAVVVAVITAMIAIRRGHPALVVMALTVTIVLFNSNPVDLMRMADRRLEAVGLGVVLALGVMAIAHPIERRFALSRGGETT